MIIGVHHVGLCVANDQAPAWLSHICDQTTDQWMTAPNVYVRVETKPGSDNFDKRTPNIAGIAHICLQSRDIELGLAKGKTSGLCPVSAPVDLGTDFRYLYAHTPDGILLELEGAPFVRDEEPRFWIGHVAFVARDLASLTAFYGKILGLKPTPLSRLRGNKRIDTVAGLDDVDLSAGWVPGLNLGLEFWQYHNPPSPKGNAQGIFGFTHVCFETDDFRVDHAHFIAQGAQPLEAQDLGLTDAKCASFRDPEGNRLHLICFDQGNDSLSIRKLPQIDILARISAQLPKRIAD